MVPAVVVLKSNSPVTASIVAPLSTVKVPPGSTTLTGVGFAPPIQAVAG